MHAASGSLRERHSRHLFSQGIARTYDATNTRKRAPLHPHSSFPPGRVQQLSLACRKLLCCWRSVVHTAVLDALVFNLPWLLDRIRSLHTSARDKSTDFLSQLQMLREFVGDTYPNTISQRVFDNVDTMSSWRPNDSSLDSSSKLLPITRWQEG